MTPQRERSALWALLLVSAGVRIASSAVFPYEQDEFYTIAEATDLFHTRVPPGIQARPFFFFLEHPFITTLPHTPTVLRVLAVLFGVLGVWATWALARRVLGQAGGLLAALLVMLSPWHLYASAFTRYYSLIFALAALVYWLLPRAYDSDRPRDYVWALVPLLLGTWTHPSFIFPAMGASIAISIMSEEGAWGWKWPSRNAWRYLWVPFLGISLTVVAVIRAVAPHGSSPTNGTDRGVLATLRLVPAMVDWTTPTIAVAALAGAILLLRSGRAGERRSGLMVLVGCACSIIALAMLSFVTAIYADYGIAALPLVLVASAGLVISVIRDIPVTRQAAALTALTALLLVGMLPSTISFLSDGTRFDYRPAFARIEKEAPALEVLTWPIPQQQAYAPQLHATLLPSTTAQLDSILDVDKSLWAVVSVKRYGIVGDDNGELAQWFSNHCRVRGQYQRPRFDYRMYRVDLWRCGESDPVHQSTTASSNRTSSPPSALPN